MQVVAVLNRKGGVGKTTIATNLARALQLEDYDVLLVDSDVQGTAQDWAAAQDDVETPPVFGADRATLHEDIPKIGDKFDVAVIDGAAKVERMSASAIKASDVVLIPVQPSAADIWAAGDLVEMVQARQELTGRPRAAFVVSRQIVGTNLASAAQDALETLGLPVLEARTSQRVAYAEAMGEGISVLDTDPHSKAAAEVRSLTEQTLALMNDESSDVTHE